MKKRKSKKKNNKANLNDKFITSRVALFLFAAYIVVVSGCTVSLCC